jgi:hypothetical protein
MSETPQYKPGDIANGHVLNSDGTWTPVAVFPTPQAPKPKKPIYKRWWFITGAAVVVFMIIGAATGSGSEEPAKADSKSSTNASEETAPKTPEKSDKADAPAKEEKPAKEFDLAVNAGKIIKDYEDNELAADQTYSGKTLKVTGVVDKIDTDMWDSDKYILNLTGGGEWEILSVRVTGLSQDELSTLKVGQKATVIAKFDDGGDLGVDLKDGHLA